jgi:molybdopterin-guanine dinucleotide biosynthesis protein MobB
MYRHLPIFGVCGWSGAGKTTLLESVLPMLLKRGLRVVVVKHDVHGITPDTPDKDSRRLYRAGADVAVHGPGKSFSWCSACDEDQLETQLSRLAEQYDLILVEGYKLAPWPKVWLTKCNELAPPEEIDNIAAVLPWDTDRTTALMALLDVFLQKIMTGTPIFGCVLIGGKSTRMGTPKHLLPCGDGSQQTWLHSTVRLLQKVCHNIVLAGAGTVPDDLQQLPRMVDAMETEGPMAGLLAAMRWAPRASWLLAACDLPTLSCGALKWLLAERRPGVWAVLPCIEMTGPVEPLLAWYDFRCLPILEKLAIADNCSLQGLANHPKTKRAVVPLEWIYAWIDVDSPESIRSY